jgi:hypothetical protein
MNSKWLEGSGRGVIVRYYTGVHLEEVRNTTKNLSQGNRYPGKDLNPGLPEYWTGVLTTRPRHSEKEIEFDHVDFIHLTHYRGQCLSVVETVMNYRVAQKAGNYLTN